MISQQAQIAANALCVGHKPFCEVSPYILQMSVDSLHGAIVYCIASGEDDGGDDAIWFDYLRTSIEHFLRDKRKQMLN